MSFKIHCPKCGRILGDTDRSIDGLRLNCRGCKTTVDVRVVVAEKNQLLDNIYKKEAK